MRNLGIILLASLCFGPSASYAELQSSVIQVRGVDIPRRVEWNSQWLPLQGVGVRKVTFLIFPFYAYIASFYSKNPLTYENRSFRFELNYLREFSLSQTQEAWAKQFELSSEVDYDGRAEHLKRLSNCFGKIQEGTIHRFEVQGSRMVISEVNQGKSQLCTEIDDDRFIRAFISIWIGAKPPTDELKAGLLLGAEKLSDRSSL